MPRYEVTAPDGARYEINAPEGATLDDAIAYAQRTYGRPAGSPAATGRAAMGESMRRELEGRSWLDKNLAAAGAAIPNMYYGAKQTLGLDLTPEQQGNLLARREIERQAPLGAIAGNVAALAPTMMIPGANTLAGAATIGAGSGLLQPTQGEESRLGNMALGAALGPAGVIAGRGLGAGWNLLQSAVEPFTAAGQQRIAGRTLQRFATDPQKAMAEARAAQSGVPGTQYTLAEATRDPGIAQLQRSAAALDPEVAGVLARRDLENQAVRTKAVQDIAGAPGQREFYEASRGAAAQQLYQQAFQEQVKDSPWIKGQITQLMKRPAFHQALKDAQTLALNEGTKLDPKNTVKVAHYAKLALDDKIANATGNEQRALIDTKDKLVAMMESPNFAPSYAAARHTYAAMSRPVNQMLVGEEYLRRLQPALGALDENLPRVKAESFAKAVRDADATVKSALGRRLKAEHVMEPEQMGTLNAVAQDLARRAVAQDLGRSVGSNTAQNLASQNIIRQTAGPLGVPLNWTEAQFLPTLLRPAGWALKAQEPSIRRELGNMLLDPQAGVNALGNPALGYQVPSQNMLSQILPLAAIAYGHQ